MFRPIKNTKLYEQVIQQIKEMIHNGTLKKGDKLPAERELAESLNISRTSIREALRALQLIGLIECKQGEGNFIKDNFENNLYEPLSTIFILNNGMIEEILEVRRIIEVETVGLVAKKITKEELEKIKNLVDTLKNTEDEHERVLIDKKFHYEIASASKNSLIISILQSVSQLIETFIKEARLRILSSHENTNAIGDQHKIIYDALEEGNSKKASEAMEAHLHFIENHML